MVVVAAKGQAGLSAQPGPSPDDLARFFFCFLGFCSCAVPRSAVPTEDHRRRNGQLESVVATLAEEMTAETLIAPVTRREPSHLQHSDHRPDR